MKKLKIKNLLIIVFLLIIVPIGNVKAQSGCCSWHKGVSGCSSSGRVICNDGTYSPSCTCTPPKVYGCTDRNAMNYNSNANTDNGSCRYQKNISETITVDYEIEYQNPNNTENGKEKIIQEGQQGQKTITYEIITDKNGIELSRTKVSEVITVEPVNEIILIEEIPLEVEDTVNKQEKKDNEQATAENDSGSIFILGIFILFIFNMVKVKKETKHFPILFYLKNINNLTVKYISYFIYFIFIFPVIIDFIIYIICKIKK